MTILMLRAALPADTQSLCRHAAATAVFYDSEIEILHEVLEDYHAGNDESGHVCTVWEADGEPAAFSYYGPAEMTDRTWELWWIAVDPRRQGEGIGKKLMAALEADIKSKNGRILLIETSSLERYDPTRQFYLKLGYVEAARIPDFYRDGDDKVIFWKRMHS